MSRLNMTSRLIAVAALGLMLPACQSVNDALGVSKQSPDEFAVVSQRPLTVPPDFTLRPPEPGAPSLTEERPMEEARDALIGEGQGAAAGTSASEQAVLSGSGEGDPTIRQTIEAERRESRAEDKSGSWFTSMFDWFGDDEKSEPTVAPDERVAKPPASPDAPAPEAPPAEQPQGSSTGDTKP